MMLEFDREILLKSWKSVIYQFRCNDHYDYLNYYSISSIVLKPGTPVKSQDGRIVGVVSQVSKDGYVQIRINEKLEFDKLTLFSDHSFGVE